MDKGRSRSFLDILWGKAPDTTPKTRTHSVSRESSPSPPSGPLSSSGSVLSFMGFSTSPNVPGKAKHEPILEEAEDFRAKIASVPEKALWIAKEHFPEASRALKLDSDSKPCLLQYETEPEEVSLVFEDHLSPKISLGLDKVTEAPDWYETIKGFLLDQITLSSSVNLRTFLLSQDLLDNDVNSFSESLCEDVPMNVQYLNELQYNGHGSLFPSYTQDISEHCIANIKWSSEKIIAYERAVSLNLNGCDFWVRRVDNRPDSLPFLLISETSLLEKIECDMLLSFHQLKRNPPGFTTLVKFGKALELAFLKL